MYGAMEMPLGFSSKTVVPVDRGPRFEYSRKAADTYSCLGIGGTTYEIGFGEIQRLLGDITNRTFLDFGSGAGRSTEFLNFLHAKRICGLDRDEAMMEAARRKNLSTVEWVVGSEVFPFREASFDGVLSTSVFVEIRTKAQMFTACSEIARVLKPGGVFVLMSTDPKAFDSVFRNFRYEPSETRESGDLAPCTVTCGEETLAIVDTFWQEADYCIALEDAGLIIESISHPRGQPDGGWQTAELDVAPFIVIKASRAERMRK